MEPLISMPGPQGLPFLSMFLNNIYKGNTGNREVRTEAPSSKSIFGGFVARLS